MIYGRRTFTLRSGWKRSHHRRAATPEKREACWHPAHGPGGGSHGRHGLGLHTVFVGQNIEAKLKGVLEDPNAEGGSEETTANEGEPSEDGGQASDGSADHSKAGESHAPSSDGHGGSGTEDKDDTFKDPYQIESALVNIKGTNASRFLVVSITIDSGQEAQREALYEILKSKDAFIRDMALEILSEFSMEDLADEPAAKNKVKIQMLRKGSRNTSPTRNWTIQSCSRNGPFSSH